MNVNPLDFPQEERDIFKYYDGAEHVYCDPGAVYRDLLVKTRGKPNELQRVANTKCVPPDESAKAISPQLFMQMEAEYSQKLADAAEAQKLLEDLVRQLFQMRPYDRKTNTGATVFHCMKVWDDFAAFMSKKNKTRESERTLSTPTDGPQDTVPTIPSGLGLS